MPANDTEAGSFIHFMTPSTTASSWRWSSFIGMPGSIDAPGGSGRSLYGGARLMGIFGGSGGAHAATVALKQIASNERPRIVFPAPVVTEKSYTTRQAQSTSAVTNCVHNDVRNLSGLVYAECLPHGLHALLMRCPLASTHDAAIDHQVVAVDEGRIVGSEEHRGLGDVVGEAGARDGLQGRHHLLGRLGIAVGLVGLNAQRLGE